MAITIRYARKEDAAAIADFSRRTFYETFVSYNTRENMDKFMNEQFTRESLIREVTAPGNICFMAMDGDQIAGYARMREHNNPPELGDQPALEIARIYADTNRIGQGVGALLMQECIHVSRQRKITLLWLGVWEYNQRAIDFYRRWGFEKFGTHVFLLGDDPQTDWLMKKSID